ncbi:hypothetical protein F2Q68_00015946 [Brassica cretica]|uniref:Uncharacterized protein n=1 Tax=Brassica cretica TaxID=69181 RepID=A0A8S9HP51_BRACR|nr:hypothetical protein F2Q68_00015946 [Brassica cretica]
MAHRFYAVANAGRRLNEQEVKTLNRSKVHGGFDEFLCRRFFIGDDQAVEATSVAYRERLNRATQEIEGRDAAARKEHNLACRSLAREYDAVLAVVKDKLRKKKKETAAEIHLQEVRARIEALTEYIEGGFELEEELERLRDREISLDLDYGLGSVSDPSLSRLELPEVFGDSVDQE